MIEYSSLLRDIIPSRPAGRAHREWIDDWIGDIEEETEQGRVSSSICLGGLVSEIWIYGKPRTDWLGIMEEHLEHSGLPLAYSEAYGAKLYGFNQWKQSPIHAVYARWCVERILGSNGRNWPELVADFVRPNGWIYNPDVSPTGLRTRMRTELFMSLAMGSEILMAADFRRIRKPQLVGAAVSLPCTGYISAEYFRLAALRSLDAEEHMVTGIREMLDKCQTDPGFSDYCIEDKIDDYMGTKKRVARDVAVFSPLSTIRALSLARYLGRDERKIEKWKNVVVAYLRKDPLGIPGLHMRDLEAEFGEGRTVYEVLAAATLLESA